MKKSNQTMFYSNYNTSNQINDGMIGRNVWSEVVPLSMPWAQRETTREPAVVGVEGVPNNAKNAINVNINQFNPNVIQFTANTHLTNGGQSADVLSPDPCTSQTATHWELLHNISTGSLSSNQHLKRRNDSSDEELEDGLRRPVKQYISEDKVSAIFNRMHISNKISQNRFECDEEFDECDETEDNCLPNEGLVQNKRIVLTDELQNAINAKDMTNKLIQNEFDKHSKAVVVWQPINHLIPIPINPKCTQDNGHDDEVSQECEHSLKNTDKSCTHFLDIERIDFTPNDYFMDSESQMEL